MLGNLALVEDDAPFGIESAGEIGGRHLADIGGQFLGLLEQRDRVQIDDAIDAFMRFLHADPVHHGAQIIAEMKRVGRLHAGKDARNGDGHGP